MMQIILLLSTAIIPACAKKPPSPYPQQKTPEDLYQLTIQYRTKCEATVISFKEYYTKNDPEYRKANMLYDETMAQFNSIFEITKSAIQNDSPFDMNEHKKDIEKAEKAGQDFLQYADSVIQPHERGERGVVALVPLFNFVYTVSKDVYSGKKNEKKKKEILSYLESLKWKHFRDIEPSQ